MAPQILQEKCASAAQGLGEAGSASAASTDPPAGGGAWSITPLEGYAYGGRLEGSAQILKIIPIPAIMSCLKSIDETEM